MWIKMLRWGLFMMIIGMIVIIPNACQNDEDGDLPIVLENLPYDNLSDYQFFTGDMSDLMPADRVLPYDLNTPLFSDYAQKARFIWIPKGRTATYSDHDAMDFPLGTIIIKNFYFDNDFTNPSQGRRILETRLLVKQDTAWQPISYVWNEAQTDAEFSLVGGDILVDWTHYDGTERSTYYHIPNRNECTGCHNLDNVLLPLGPKARNLNKDYDYEDGTMNQLDKWVEMDYLQNVPGIGSRPRAAVYDDPAEELNFRARTYLDVNCGHCHNPLGPAKNTGLTLTIEEMDSYTLGICKPPIAAGQGSGGLQFGIVPGEPENSIMHYRMNSTELDVMMPELGRSVNHDEGIQLIYDWIAQLEGDCN